LHQVRSQASVPDEHEATRPVLQAQEGAQEARGVLHVDEATNEDDGEGARRGGVDGRRGAGGTSEYAVDAVDIDAVLDDLDLTPAETAKRRGQRAIRGVPADHDGRKEREHRMQQ
jgi:hypothetical protein